LDITGNGVGRVADCRDTDNGGIDSDRCLVGHERRHVVDPRIVGDDQHLPFLVEVLVPGTGSEIEEVRIVEILERLTRPARSRLALQHVHPAGSGGRNLYGQLCIDAQHPRHGVVLKWIDLDDHTPEIPQNVGRMQASNLSWIEGIGIIGRTERVGNRFGIHLPGQVPLGGSHTGEDVAVLRIEDLHHHPGVIRDDQAAVQMREGRSAFLEEHRFTGKPDLLEFPAVDLDVPGFKSSEFIMQNDFFPVIGFNFDADGVTGEDTAERNNDRNNNNGIKTPIYEIHVAPHPGDGRTTPLSRSTSSGQHNYTLKWYHRPIFRSLFLSGLSRPGRGGQLPEQPKECA